MSIYAQIDRHDAHSRKKEHMSTSGFMPRKDKGPGHFIFALLVGALLALPCLLPSAAFARSSGRGAAFSSNDNTSDFIRDSAGVSIVRLLANYTNGASDGTVNCTGLGILVASKPVTTGSSKGFRNWVLTDANLVNSTMTACGTTGGNMLLGSLQIWASEEYTAPTNAHQMLGELNICSDFSNGVLTCKDAQPSPPGSEKVSFISTSTDPYTLFSFLTANEQPYLTLGFGTTAKSPTLSIGLTQNAQIEAPTVTDPNSIQSFLQPTVLNNNLALPVTNPPSPNSPPVTLTQTSVEGGTPMVEATGKLVGMYVNVGQNKLNISSLQKGLQDANLLPGTPKAGSLAFIWDAGISAFYQGKYQQAHDQFKQILNKPPFTAPMTFDTLAQKKISSTPPTPTRSGQTSSSPTDWISQLSLSDPLVINTAVGAAIVLFLVVIVLIWRARRRRRHALELERMEQENLEAQRQAEEEIQNMRAQRPNTEVPCPNCHMAVRLGDDVCPHCHMALKPSASGLGLRMAETGPLPPPQPPNMYNLPTRPSVSDMPTMHFPPSPIPATSGDLIAEQKTLTRKNLTKGQQTSPHIAHSPNQSLSLMVGTRSDPGIKRKHKPNEDSLFAMQGSRTHNSEQQEFGLFVVADGMGGHANGQDASRQAIQTMINYMLPRISSSEPMDDDAFTNLLGEGVQHANQAVHQRNMEARADMGTTMTTSLIVGSTAYVANVGDSRTYLYREGHGLSRVTNDHSVVASLVEAGIIQPDDIYTHPKRNQIYRSLGEKAIVEVDTFKVDLQPGDILLLCSDGLWDMVRDPKIQQVLASYPNDPNKTGQELIKAAWEGGGEDNVSVIVVQVTPIDPATGKSGINLLAKPDTVTLPKLPPA
jgi:serine/threonine protein phosphatase PrpC